MPINRIRNSFVVKAGCFQRWLEAQRGDLVPSVLPLAFIIYILSLAFSLVQVVMCLAVSDDHLNTNTWKIQCVV